MQIDLATPGGITVALLPEIVLSTWILVITLVAAWWHQSERDQRLVGQLSLVGLSSALLAILWLWTKKASAQGIAVMIALDTFRYATGTVFLVGAMLSVMLSLGYLGRERLLAPEYYLLLLLATVGMLFMGGGSNLIVIFLGLELMSIPVYVLAGVNRRSRISAEAGLKYFLLGAFASAFFLYGIALIYGATGTTTLSIIDQMVRDGVISNTLLVMGVGMLLIGFGFKVAAVPFHMWTPDVYDGAPTPITAFMAAAVKAAGFAALVRVLITGLGSSVEIWQDAVWWLAAVTMLVGNLVALAQRQLKRMLAYSSIAHAGYLMAAVASGSQMGAAAFLFYIVAYTLMTVGAFAVLTAVGREDEREVSLRDLAGIASQRPWLAFAMAVFMMSLLGFPGTAGFIGKWYILSAMIQSDQGLLAVILVAATVISAGYYLPVIMSMYMKPAPSEAAYSHMSLATGARLVVGATASLLLLFGVWPNKVLDLAEDGADSLRPGVVVAIGDNDSVKSNPVALLRR